MAPSIQEHIVVIKEVVQDTPQVRLLRVSRPAGWDFLCGQFFMVSLADDPHTRVARAYSAASSPLEEEYIEIGFDKVGVLANVLDAIRESGINAQQIENTVFQEAAAACCVAASVKVRSTNGARPRSMTPSMGMTYTTGACAGATASRLRPAIPSTTRHTARYSRNRRVRQAGTAPATRGDRCRVVTIVQSRLRVTRER